MSTNHPVSLLGPAISPSLLQTPAFHLFGLIVDWTQKLAFSKTMNESHDHNEPNRAEKKKKFTRHESFIYILFKKAGKTNVPSVMLALRAALGKKPKDSNQSFWALFLFTWAGW